MKVLTALGKFIPSFAGFGMVWKISLTVFLLGICADLFYAKINPALPLLKGALIFSPVKYAESLVEEGKLKTAEEYIDFYDSIPGYSSNGQLEELRNRIHAKRTGIISGTLHQGSHILKGIKGEESDEVAGQAADMVMEIGLSDARDLYTEWNNYSAGREVDKLSAGLAGIGLTLTLADFAGKVSGIFTGGSTTAATQAIITPLKQTVLMIKKSLKIMNPKLRKACDTLFKPVFSHIKKMNLLDKMPLPHIPAGSMKDKIVSIKKFKGFDQFEEYLRKNYNKFLEIADLVKSKIGSLQSIIGLARKDPGAAKLIIQNSTNIKEVENLSKMALSLGKEGSSIFRFGGKDALHAMNTLGKEGKLSGKVIKQSMRMGETGLKAVAKGCWHALEKMVNLAIKYKYCLWWFTLQWFLAKIPLFVVILVEIFIFSIIIKTWTSSFTKIFSQPE